MKNIVTTAILFAFACIATGSASAQKEQFKVNVPFSFTVGSKTLPAGTYTVSSASNSPFITIDSATKPGVRVLAVNQAPNGKISPENAMFFHKWGERYFVSDIHLDGSSSALHLSTTKEEKRAKAQTAEAELHNSNVVLVALK